ncbi:hypothetical protein VNI00_006454 [Paramarasmius palmivorus]|uniref:PNPLA domain-containing protein n=1 Tax=Paramarasmius palmivorus TaxID=297713 RepID=A0AAW0D8W2_9AGAR
MSQSQRPLRILSLDGGGYRGISSLAILNELMKSLADSTGKVPKPCEVFDFIIGTSTGGLIALLVGRLGLSVEEARAKYLELGTKIFVNDKGNIDYVLKGTSRYDTRKLEGFYRDILGDQSLLLPGTVRTAVTTTINQRVCDDAILLRTYADTEGCPPPTSKTYSWTAVQAARATSAAPTYFDPITVDGTTFADAGGAGFNNPTEVAIREVAMIPEWINRGIGVIVSLGTGLNDTAYSASPSQAEIRLNPVIPNSEAYGIMGANFLSFGGFNLPSIPSFPSMPRTPNPLDPTAGVFTGLIDKVPKVEFPVKYNPLDPTGGVLTGLIEKRVEDASNRLENLTTYLANVASNSEQAHVRMTHSPYKKVYWRFNVPMIGQYDLADVAKGVEMETKTASYLKEAAAAEAMKKLVAVLKRDGQPGEKKCQQPSTSSKSWISGDPFHHKLHAQDEDMDLSDAATTFRRCVDIAGAFDAGLCARWEKDIDALLVFVRLSAPGFMTEVLTVQKSGLFSAVVTAFAVESYKTLQPDPQEDMVSLLRQISQQLASPSTPFPQPSQQSEFIAISSSVQVNVFYFLSLILSLAAAHLSILCKQWMREYQREYPAHLNSRQMLAVRQSRHEGLHAWGVPELIASIPLLLQVATALFFIGVAKMLWDIHRFVAMVVLVAVMVCLAFLIITTTLAPLLLILTWVFDKSARYLPWQCPYKTPLGWIIIRIATPILLILNRAIPSGRGFSFIRGLDAIVRYIQSLGWGMYDLKYCDGELYEHGMQKTMGWMYAFTPSGVFADCLRELDVETAVRTLRDLVPFLITARQRASRVDTNSDAEKGMADTSSSTTSTAVISVDVLESFLDAASGEIMDITAKKDIIDITCLLFRRYAPSNARIRYCLEGCIRIVNSVSAQLYLDDSRYSPHGPTLPPSTIDIIIYLLEMYSGDLDDCKSYFMISWFSFAQLSKTHPGSSLRTVANVWKLYVTFEGVPCDGQNMILAGSKTGLTTSA